MENAHDAIETLKQLKAIGVRLSIDDFGTGYSSLSYLHRFPFDILKIDRSFVNRMNTDKDSLSIVETIVTLAKKLGKSIVAEGVEGNKHKQMLTALSCDYGQGYLFSKPLNSDQAKEFMRSNAVTENTDFQSANLLPQNNIETITNQYPM
jgi:EAL domain-containing protein (putative c-di-GMP-specific phosphodiesterase class I)